MNIQQRRQSYSIIDGKKLNEKKSQGEITGEGGPLYSPYSPLLRPNCCVTPATKAPSTARAGTIGACAVKAPVTTLGEGGGWKHAIKKFPDARDVADKCAGTNARRI